MSTLRSSSSDSGSTARLLLTAPLLPRDRRPASVPGNIAGACHGASPACSRDAWRRCAAAAAFAAASGLAGDIGKRRGAAAAASAGLAAASGLRGDVGKRRGAAAAASTGFAAASGLADDGGTCRGAVAASAAGGASALPFGGSADGWWRLRGGGIGRSPLSSSTSSEPCLLYTSPSPRD